MERAGGLEVRLVDITGRAGMGWVLALTIWVDLPQLARIYPVGASRASLPRLGRGERPGHPLGTF